MFPAEPTDDSNQGLTPSTRHFATMPRVSLRQGLDRDVYQLVRKFEDIQELEGSTSRITVTAVYNHIKGSNSSLRRLKRKPLEESIDRALMFRKQDLEDEDSEDEIEVDVEEPKDAPKDVSKPATESSLMNRQLARRWKLAEKKDRGSEQEEGPETHGSPVKTNGTKKRRLSRSPSPADATRATNPDRNGTESQTKPPAPKRAKGYKGYHVIDSPDTLQLGGISSLVEDFEKRLWFQMAQRADEDDAMDGVEETPEIRPDIRPLLLTGPLGCGKSTLLQHLASRWKVPILKVGCKFLATSDKVEKSLSDVYEEARAMAPCIVEFKRFDLLWPSQASGQVQPGAADVHVEELLRRFSTSQDPKRPIAIAATTRHPEAIPPDFFMAGLFGETYTIKAPNPEARGEILKTLGERYGSQDLDFAPVTGITHGYVADDLLQLFWTGALTAQGAGRPMTIQDLEDAAKNHVPHLRREGFS
ncbi:ATP-binding protein, partial [Candidatus Bathyarchaeota archaeon]|nr:ATP-binding protein [Candidatus Bathyarchaeota archaeon]